MSAIALVPPEPPLSKQERLRRLILVCCSALRNFAYYRTGWDGGRAQFHGELLKTANGNFVDMGVMEWCKLYGDNDQNYHWSMMLPDVDHRRRFKLGLLEHLGCGRADWNTYQRDVIAYRNNFLAHLNDHRKFKVPKLEVAIASTVYYAEFMIAEFDDGRTYGTLPRNLSAYYEHCLTEGLALY